MKKSILSCNNCHIYTLKENCPECGNKVFSSKPAKFSIEDKYLKYRLKAKENALRN
ncbi:MAG: Ribosome biogenesis protein Nop10 [archaeon GW2011_AR20]|nr:MAG: Ribosome biogenesis protein Nop10 [archaeon GW2011_AR20]MBS3160285.1 RNA-protein complex protein Nop10 [Candidatus Woesearchaeota archaeon]